MKYTPTVIRIIASSEPGIFFDTFGVRAMMSMLSTPMPAVSQSIVPMCSK